MFSFFNLSSIGCLGRDVVINTNVSVGTHIMVSQEVFTCIYVKCSCNVVFQVEGKKDQLASGFDSRQLWWTCFSKRIHQLEPLCKYMEMKNKAFYTKRIICCGEQDHLSTKMWRSGCEQLRDVETPMNLICGPFSRMSPLLGHKCPHALIRIFE